MSPGYIWTDQRRLKYLSMRLSVAEQSYEAARKAYLEVKQEIEALEKKIEKNRSGAV
jgi:predicted  nucleic acid-binding Zn-ribbon protein